jgi:hypothetical protein
MGSAANVVNVPEILKSVWKDEIFDFMYEDQPWLGIVPKDTTWDGLYQVITVMYGGMAGRSNDFDAAKANKSPPKYKQMQIATRDNFGLWSVDHKLITLSRNQRGALVRALAESTEKATSKLKRSSCWALWRNGGGAIGAVSTSSGATVTLYDINDIRNFDLDDYIEFSVDDGYTGSAGVHIGALRVTGLNEDTGVITFDANVSSVPGFANGDFLFHQGDYAKSFLGVPAYATLTNPGTTDPASIWGMSRTDFPTRLAGSRFTSSNLLATEAIKQALAKAHRRNIETTHIFAPPEVYNDIEMSLQGAKTYTTEKVGTVGYKALEFTSQGGKTVKMYSDADIPRNKTATTKYVFGLNVPTWKFHTAGEYPMWLNKVGGGAGQFMTEQNANATEGRLGGYGQLYTTAPGQNWVLALT